MFEGCLVFKLSLQNHVPVRSTMARGGREAQQVASCQFSSSIKTVKIEGTRYNDFRCYLQSIHDTNMYLKSG